MNIFTTGRKNLYMAFILVLLSSFAHANDSILDWINKLRETPFIPGASLLPPEIAPAAAIIVSHGLQWHNLYQRIDVDRYSKATVINICQEAEKNAQRPLIIIPEGERADLVKKFFYEAIDNDDVLKSVVGAAQRCKESLLFAPVSQSLTWMQDHFSALYDPRRGVVIKILGKYATLHGPRLDKDYHQNLFAPLLEITEKDPETLKISISPDTLEPQTGACGYALASSYGGNALGLTQGILLTGENQEESIYACYGADRDHHLRIPTGWLEVGHVDEIISLIKEQPATRTQPRQIFLAIASPHLALTLLENSDDKFTTADTDDLQELRIIKKEIGKFDLANDIDELFEPDDLDLKPNKKVYEKAFYEGASLRRYNDNIQWELNNIKRIIEEKLHNYHAYEVVFIEVPALFYFKNRGASPLFPAATNLLLTGGRALYPEQFNKTFDDYIVKSFQAIGINAVAIDTKCLHRYGGNLHCATKAIRVGGKCHDEKPAERAPLEGGNAPMHFCNIF